MKKPTPKKPKRKPKCNCWLCVNYPQVQWNTERIKRWAANSASDRLRQIAEICEEGKIAGADQIRLDDDEMEKILKLVKGKP